jgi:hypothetical protein
MLEVTSISASSYDPESLTPLLDEHTRDGWEVISIVSAGTKVVAYLQRDSDGETPAADADEPAAVDEPAGWAVAPEDDSSEPGASEAVAAVAVTEAAVVTEAAPEPEPVAAEQPAEAAVAEPESTVPAGWYADPSGRFELRYWDGSAWTEHVSRAGQQYTDPPVA